MPLEPNRNIRGALRRQGQTAKPATHPIKGDALRALRQLRREQDPPSSFVFCSERGTPFTADALNRKVKRIGEKAKLGFQVRMLRHSCGTTPGPYRTGLGTGPFSIQCATLN